MILPFDGQHHVIPGSAFVAPSVDNIGDATLGEEASPPAGGFGSQITCYGS